MNYSPFKDDFDLRADHAVPRPRSLGGSGPVEIITPKRGPWTGNSQLGQGYRFGDILNLITSDAYKQTIIKMDENGPPSPRMVSLWIENDLQTGARFRTTAEIKFGGGGIVHSFEMDWKRGLVVSIPCNYLEVTARFEDPIGTPGAPSIPAGLFLGVIISDGGTAHALPTRTILPPYDMAGSIVKSSVPAGGTTTETAIPSFARRLRIYGRETSAPFTNDPLNVLQYQPYSGGPSIGHFFGSAGWDTDGIPVPEGGRFFTFANNTASTVQPVMEFELAL